MFSQVAKVFATHCSQNVHIQSNESEDGNEKKRLTQNTDNDNKKQQ